MSRVDGAADVLAASHGHPYARFATSMATGVTGVRAGDAVMWYGDGIYGRVGHGLGEPSTLDRLLAGVTGTPGWDKARWVNLPRRRDLPPGYVLNESWDLLWLTEPVPPQPAQDRVVPLDETAADAITALLDLAMPETPVRPGTAHAHAWYGIWVGPVLVACAADRSGLGTEPGSAPVGILGGVAVHPGYRRRGLGAAVSAELTRRLQASYPLVVLGVADGNTEATRVYQRLGYSHRHPLTAVRRPR